MKDQVRQRWQTLSRSKTQRREPGNGEDVDYDVRVVHAPSALPAAVGFAGWRIPLSCVETALGGNKFLTIRFNVTPTDPARFRQVIA